jgi:hypothetical protein
MDNKRVNCPDKSLPGRFIPLKQILVYRQVILGFGNNSLLGFYVQKKLDGRRGKGQVCPELAFSLKHNKSLITL